jgi:hypothetical protein
MKKVITLVIVAINLLCVNVLFAEKVLGDGNVVKEDREVADISKLHVSGVFDIYISQGDEESLVIETDENLQEYILSSVKNGTLTVKERDGVKLRDRTQSNLYITIKDITEIVFTGVGDLESATELHFDELKIENKGVGDIELLGKATQVSIENLGVGDIANFGFEVEDLTVTNLGVGNVEVYVTNLLDVKNGGVGNVTFKGDPKTVNIKSNGVGSVKER